MKKKAIEEEQKEQQQQKQKKKARKPPNRNDRSNSFTEGINLIMPANNKTPTKPKHKAKSMFTQQSPNGYQTLDNGEDDDGGENISKDLNP